MPQVDLASVCAGYNDRKIACETLAGDNPMAVDQPWDFPPESFVLSNDAAEDWIDRNVFIERKNSGRSSSLHSANLNPIPNPNNPTLNSGSQRYSLTVKTKPSFLGLPKPQKAAYAETKCRKPVNIRLFPKRWSSSNSRRGKSAVQMSEPSSPKVSCIGRVRSRRDRGRRKKSSQNQAAEPAIKRSRSGKSHKTGFWNNFRSIFRSKKGHKSTKADEPSRESPAAEALKKSRSVRKRDLSGLSTAAEASRSSVTSQAEAPGLGGAKRFSSGRRSDAWAAEMEVEGAKSEPLDRGSIWERRNGGGPPTEIIVDRKWGSVAVGPVSV